MYIDAVEVKNKDQDTIQNTMCHHIVLVALRIKEENSNKNSMKILTNKYSKYKYISKYIEGLIFAMQLTFCYTCNLYKISL